MTAPATETPPHARGEARGRPRPSSALDQMVVLALGGNLPAAGRAPAEVVEAGFAAIEAAGLRVVRRSRLWTSLAWPRPEEPAFVNAVALVEAPQMSPLRLLHLLKSLELGFGPRGGLRNGPRALDLDIIAFGRRRLTAPALRLPHPRAADRLFVMGPLDEIAPDWRHPVTGETARDGRARAHIGADARPIP